MLIQAIQLHQQKVAVNFEKKFKSFEIIGGSFEGKKIDKTKINFLAALPSLDEIRGKLVGLISTPAQKIASVSSSSRRTIGKINEFTK